MDRTTGTWVLSLSIALTKVELLLRFGPIRLTTRKELGLLKTDAGLPIGTIFRMGPAQF